MLLKTNEQKVVGKLNVLRKKIFSNVGGWFPGKGVFSHGYNMLDELVGKKSYFQIVILNATGKLVDKELADWIEAICGCLSWPDPRIWCNQVGALAGSAKTSVVAATAMGCMASDSRAYGPRTLIAGVEFIQNALHKTKNGYTPLDIVLSEVKKHRGKPQIVGYVRPIAKGDERIETMERVSRSLGFTPGDHLQLAYTIEEILLEKYDESMNINGYMSAFLSDQGFTPSEVYNIYAMMVQSGVTACYLDSYNKPSDEFLPLQCEDIQYTGENDRPVPERD